MSVQLIIFDCDGVLVDTERPVNEVISKNLGQHGLTIPPEECQKLFVGGTIYGVQAEAIKRGAILSDDWIEEIYDAIYARLSEGVEVIPGVHELLDHLDSAGIPTAIASNGPLQKMRLSLGPSGLWERFDGRVYSREDHAPKPAPDMLLHAMRVAGAHRQQTYLIDDSPTGCLAAKAAGVGCFGFVPTGSVDGLVSVGAVPIRELSEVLTKLKLI